MMYTNYVLDGVDRKAHIVSKAVKIDNILIYFNILITKLESGLLLMLAIELKLLYWGKCYIGAVASHIEPLLFLLHINDIASRCHFSKFLFYADDIEVFFKITDQYNL